MEEINNKIAKLQQDFGNMLPKATNEAAIWVDKVEDLAGLSEADIAQCKKDAESRDGKAPYCIVITNTTQQPILASLENRALLLFIVPTEQENSTPSPSSLRWQSCALRRPN